MAAIERVQKTILLVAALAILGVSCTSNGGDPESLGSESITTVSSAPTTTASTPTTPTTTEIVPVTAFPEPGDGEVFDEYIADRLEKFREIVRAAAENPTLTPEIDFPEIADYAAGPMLEANYELLVAFAQEGTALREPGESLVGRTVAEKTRISPVIDGSGDTVTVFECSVDDEDVVDPQTGEIKLSGVLTGLAVVTMQRFGGGWKAVDGEVTQTLRGVDGCFLASEAEFPY